MTQVGSAQWIPPQWLHAVATSILSGDVEYLTTTWNVSSNVTVVRQQLENARFPENHWTRFSLAQSLIEVVREGGDSSVLDNALIALSQVVEQHVLCEQIRGLAMLLLLSPPLARADTFERLCAELKAVPAGRSGGIGEPDRIGETDRG